MRSVSDGNTIGERSGPVGGRYLWIAGAGDFGRSRNSSPSRRAGDRFGRSALKERIRSEVFSIACPCDQSTAIDVHGFRGSVG